MDFGLSWVSQEDKSLEPGVPYAYLCGVGTPEYTAPETWIDDDFRSPRSAEPVNVDDPEESISSRAIYGIEVDYWAFGCIAFELEAYKSRVRALSYLFVSASDTSNPRFFSLAKIPKISTSNNMLGGTRSLYSVRMMF